MKIVKRLFALVLLIVVAAVIGGIAYLYSTAPGTSGEYAVSGISGDITIRFDEFARPYVYAETLEDALFAQGWLHGTHRLWQMDMFRRAGKGRLSELLGSSMIESDKELWRIGVPQLARELQANASPDTLDQVDAYVMGVNAAIKLQGTTPPEYTLLQSEPAPWESIDVFALGALMAFQSAGNFENELLRLALFNELNDEHAAVFLPDESEQTDFPYIIPPSARTAKGQIEQVLDRLSATDPLDQSLMPSFAFGSNGWVVAPERSDTGNALFAFDSHDALGLPNLFYEVHLFFGDGRQIRGWSVAGLPGVINGYNERIAWGFTNIGDSQDLYLETRSDSDPLQFKDGEDWYEARTESVEIPVKGRDEPEELQITYTKNGPLISEDPPIALRWTIQELNGLGLDSLFELNLARNWEEFTGALDRFAAPPLNATYADVDGNIGFRTAGLLPVRRQGEGLLPLPGDDPDACWDGFVDPAALPEVLNPDEGFIAAANARVNPEGDGPLVSADNAAGYRIRRLQDVLSKAENYTVDDMAALQMDWHDTQAELLLPALLPALEAGVDSPLAQQAADIVKEWKEDLVAAPDSAGAIIFQAWYCRLAETVFKPGMSESVFAQLFKNNYPLNHALDRLILRDTDHAWWRGDRDGVIREAFGDAVNEIAAVQGDSAAAWRLDRMHRVLLNHELGAAVPQLGFFFNLEAAPWGGSTSTVGRGRYRYDRAYDVTAAATVRVVGDMGEVPKMKAVIPGGQSGHPLSAHYDDQFQSWLNGEVHPIADTWEQVEGDVQRLLPAD